MTDGRNRENVEYKGSQILVDNSSVSDISVLRPPGITP